MYGAGYQCDVKYDRCNAASPVSPLLMVLAEMSAQSPMLEITPGENAPTCVASLCGFVSNALLHI